MERIVYESTLILSEATVTSEKTTWKDIEGVLPPSETASEVAEDYTFIINGHSYRANFFQNGTTKYKCAYRTRDHDTITLEYIKETGLSNIIIRHNEIELLENNTFVFLEKIQNTSNQKVLIRFSKNIAYIVDEDGQIKEV